MVAKVVNLFAGPGSGKSTTAAGIFYLLKTRDVNCELVQEYAKWITWQKHHATLEDQLYILAKQNKKLWALRKQVDYIITDSPLLLGLHYKPPEYFPEYFEKFMFEVWNHYDNTNYFIRRTKKYQPIGRNQTEDEAKRIDDMLEEFLTSNSIPYKVIDGDPKAPYEITEDLLGPEEAK